MFIRFVSGDIDEDSHPSVGSFTAAYELLAEVEPAEYEYQPLVKQLEWFKYRS